MVAVDLAGDLDSLVVNPMGSDAPFRERGHRHDGFRGR